MIDMLLPIAGVAFFLLMLGIVAGFSRLGRITEPSGSPRLAAVSPGPTTAPGVRKGGEVHRHVALLVEGLDN